MAKGSNSWSSKISDVRLPPLPQGWNDSMLEGLFENACGHPVKLPLVGFLIEAAMKPTILDVLRDNFGVERNTVYPDMFGLSD